MPTALGWPSFGENRGRCEIPECVIDRDCDDNREVCTDFTCVLPPAECEEQRARVTARSWLTGTGWTMIGVSGMIATVALSSYLFGDSTGDAAPVRVAPIATGNYTGAAVVGVW